MKKSVFAILLMFLSISSFALTNKELEKQGKLLADFLITGRGTVATVLGKFKINDAKIGNKGFTAKWFKGEINKRFKEKHGIDIITKNSKSKLPGKTMDYLVILLNASAQVVTNNLDLINMKDVGFKGFIPATYGLQTGKIFTEKTGITLKQTTTVLRNTYNAPDKFEKEVLGRMEKSNWKKGKIVSKTEGNNFRVMRPIYIKKGCLKCHGDPKGELDVAGRKKEGYKVGDLRGAISVVIPK